jgi:tetratricopeptide (TPR) repeat protein
MTGSLRAPQAAIVVVLLTCLAYLNSFGGAFVFDDIGEIYGNPAMEQLFPPWEAMFNGPKAPARPLPYLTFAIDTNLWGPAPFGFHITNLLVHVVAALALFDLVRLTLCSPRLRDQWAESAVPLATVIATLWAIHPLQTQAVTYIYQRMESMAGMFCLLSLAAFARAAASDWSWKLLAWSVTACAAAMASKENAVVLPVLLVLYDWFFSPSATFAAWWADVWKRRWYVAALALTWLILAATLASQAGKYQEFGDAKRSSLTYALTQPGVILHYLRLSIWPIGLCFDYSGWPEVRTVTAAQLPAYLAIGTLVVLTAFGTIRRWPQAWLGVVFLGTLAPTSSVLPVEAFVNEHRMYLPLAAVVAALVLAAAVGFGRATPWLSQRLPYGPRGVERLALAATGIIVIALLLGTQLRNQQYASTALLWNDVLDHDPGNYRALWNFADMMNLQGKEAEAFELADKALERKPSCDIYSNLAAVHLTKGDYATAERFCRRGLERQLAVLPADHRAVLATQGDLATALRLQSKTVEADEICSTNIGAMRRVLGVDHTVTLSAEQIIAEGLAQRGAYQDAETLARSVLARALKAKGPTDPIVINATVALARVLDTAGRPADAQRAIQGALNAVIRKGSPRPNDRLLLEDLLAEFLERDGKIDEAVAVRRRVADMNERVYGKQHPLTASALNKHALATAAQATSRGNNAQAAEIYARLYETHTESLGVDHVETRAVDAKLQAARQRAEQPAQP